MLLNTLRIVSFKNHIFYHGTAIFVICILLTALHIHHIPIFHEKIYIPNFHVISPNFKTSVFSVQTRYLRFVWQKHKL